MISWLPINAEIDAAVARQRSCSDIGWKGEDGIKAQLSSGKRRRYGAAAADSESGPYRHLSAASDEAQLKVGEPGSRPIKRRRREHMKLRTLSAIHTESWRRLRLRLRVRRASLTALFLR